MAELEFSTDWFVRAKAPETWPTLIGRLPGRQSFLEIGSYEGQSTAWIVANMMEEGGSITCIDTFAGDETTELATNRNPEASFDHNVSVLAGRYPARGIVKRKGTAQSELARLICDGAQQSFDFIYVDGSHLGWQVLSDACMAWPLLKRGGVMVFDDYLWGNPRDILHRPKLAIDSFMNVFAEQVQPIFIHQQLAVAKLGG